MMYRTKVFLSVFPAIVFVWSTCVAVADGESPVPRERVALSSTNTVGIRCELQKARISITRNKFYDGNQTAGLLYENFYIVLKLVGPTDIKLLLPSSNRNPLGSTLAAAIDDKGEDITKGPKDILWSYNSYSRRSMGDVFCPRSRERTKARGEIATVEIGHLRMPTEGAKSLRLLEGAIAGKVVLEEEMVRLNPLRAHIDRPVTVTDGSTITFTRIHKNRLEYTHSWRDNKKRQPYVEIDFFAKDGEEIKRGGHSGSGRGGRAMEYELQFPEPFPQDGYVVMKYPSKTKLITIPFSFKNVELP